MFASPTVFLDFNLPNATTWFYFSFLLAVALFFKFSRVLSMRNWDVVTLFLLAPGLLLIQRARPDVKPLHQQPATRVAAALAGAGGSVAGSPVALVAVAELVLTAQETSETARWRWFGYLWLMIGSGYLFVRCLFDLTLVQRPALEPNLNSGGLAWFAGALFICLMAVAFRDSDRPVSPLDPKAPDGVPSAKSPVGPQSASLDLARQELEKWAALLARALAVVCHLAVVAGLIVLGRRHFLDPAGGMAAATFYLLLPYTGLYVSQWHHVLPTALVVWALVSYRFPIWSGMLMGLASGTMYFPALALPLWLSFYWRRGAGRFALATTFTAGLALAITAFDLWLKNQLNDSLQEAWSQAAWQAWKVPTTEGFWTGVHGAYRIPICLAFIAFVLLTAFWPRPKNLAHVMTLTGAVFIGIQFWYADQGGVYVLWYLPLLLLLVFRPNLEERRPPELNGHSGWLVRLGRGVRLLVQRPASPGVTTPP